MYTLQEVSKGIPHELGCRKFVSAYADNVTMIVSDMSEIVGITPKEYEGLTGAMTSVTYMS